MFELSMISPEVLIQYGIKILAFIGGLAALIFVHELGHFLVARKCGVVVEKFSLGFGPKIFGYKSPPTEVVAGDEIFIEWTITGSVPAEE